MFVVGAAGVQPSGLAPLARKATNAIVKLATEHINGLSDADIAALSNSYGNFDRLVGLGWLLGDALGSPLMERAAACAVGVKAQRRASKIKSEVRDGKLAIQRILGKLAAEDPQRETLERQLEAVESGVLCAEVDGVLPAAASAPAAAPQATGSRKRAREVEAEEPSHEAIIAEFQDSLLASEKWVKEAEADCANAAERSKAKQAVMQRM